MDFSFLLSNSLINVGVVSWLVAQLIKTALDAVKHRSFNRQRLAGAGGMPSSHSSTVCALAASAFLHYGPGSFEFSVSFILAMVVMYDATGVRQETGKQAKVLEALDYIRQTLPGVVVGYDASMERLYAADPAGFAAKLGVGEGQLPE